MKGQRYELNLDDLSSRPAQVGNFSLFRDIKERNSGSTEPVAPKSKILETGFPAHTKKRLSRFKAQNTLSPSQKAAASKSSSNKSNESNFESDEQAAIDEENKQRLASMSQAEILREQADLRSNLSPKLVEMLMKRANLPRAGKAHPPRSPESPNVDATIPRTASNEAVNDPVIGKSNQTLREGLQRPSSGTLPGNFDMKTEPGSSTQAFSDSTHSLKAPQPPNLDPDDPEFNQKLHSAYFPALPADPSALSWMQPISEDERAEYSPARDTLTVSSLRFDFKGQLLSPRRAAQIPVSKGLHHHGQAPDSAGYTVGELALLAQSVIPAQRCIAYQTLGRLLYRLGRGEYGHEGDDIYEGLWQAIEQTKVLDAMIQVAARENEGHRSAWVYATDAVHLWRKGGGKRWQGR